MNTSLHLIRVCTATSLVLGAQAAFAQSASTSSVTIAGVADVGLRQVRNEGQTAHNTVVNGSNSTSRLIVRGTEDLGAGWSAGFHLEHGILMDTGTAASSTQFWDRRATLSLVASRAGEVRAGRDFVPSYVAWSRHDPFSYVGVGSSSNLVSATPTGPIKSAFAATAATTVRANNAVQWLLPAGLGGVEGGVLLAPGEGRSSASGLARVIGLRLGYADKQLNVSAAATRTDNDLTTSGHFQDTVVGGGYDFGAVRVSAAVRRFEQAASNQTNLLLGVRVPVSSGEVKLSYNRASFSGKVGTTSLDSQSSRQLALGYVHDLSKRTALYGTVSRISNSATLNTAISGGTGTLAKGGSSTGLELGMRHTF